LVEVLLGVAGTALLHVFFRAVRSRWPESYYGVMDFTSYQLSLRLGSYIVFRFLPVMIAAFAVSAVAISVDASGPGAAMIAAGLHAVTTAGRAALIAIRTNGIFGRRLLLVAHAGVFFMVLGAGVVGGLLGTLDRLRVLVPDGDALVSDLWTALLAGVVGAYLVRMSSGSEVDAAELIRQSSRRIRPGLVHLADELAAEYTADPHLVRAILLVENLQRPGWIRGIERMAGRALRVGSYGIMQVQSGSPLSDADSIREAVSTRLAGRLVPETRQGTPDDTVLRRHIRAYNGNDRFVELVTRVYYELRLAGS